MPTPHVSHSDRFASRDPRFPIALLFVALASVVAAGCGKVGPPLPPLPRTVVRPSQLSATQVGDRVRLAWAAPNLDLRKSEDGSVLRADVYRLRQSRDAPAVAFADAFDASADLVGFIDYAELVAQLKADQRLTFEDKLDLSQPAVLSNTRFVYAVRYVDRRERKQALSNLVTIEPVPGIAKPPTELAAEQAQDEVTITWTPPAQNLDGSEPAQVIGYNVYRTKPNAERPGRPLNDQPLTEPGYRDTNFVYLTPYAYVVRSVSQGPDAQVESSASEPLVVTPRDTFAPTAPTSVTAASAGGVISVFWPANPERDVRGYVIERTTGTGAAGAVWETLVPSPVSRTTFRDEQVVIGRQYAYRLIAIDRYGNASPPSAAVSETASQ